MQRRDHSKRILPGHQRAHSLKIPEKGLPWREAKNPQATARSGNGKMRLDLGELRRKFPEDKMSLHLKGGIGRALPTDRLRSVEVANESGDLQGKSNRTADLPEK